MPILTSFSRTRGGDPGLEYRSFEHFTFFPHSRGWSRLTQEIADAIQVFPALAGVILGLLNLWRYLCRFSRTRGGDPSWPIFVHRMVMFFPHSRGWSRYYWTGVHHRRVFPALAGVILDVNEIWKKKVRFSRTRGGDPKYGPLVGQPFEFFPHSRGWSYRETWYFMEEKVFPALAGVILYRRTYWLRTRSFSRTRGGDPRLAYLKLKQHWFFPHSRGWSHFEKNWKIRFAVFPALAGVILFWVRIMWFWMGFSRTRGGDPNIWVITPTIPQFFPHSRGWSYTHIAFSDSPNVFPALAGVIPVSFILIPYITGFSRTRGGDPIFVTLTYLG